MDTDFCRVNRVRACHQDIELLVDRLDNGLCQHYCYHLVDHSCQLVDHNLLMGVVAVAAAAIPAVHNY